MISEALNTSKTFHIMDGLEPGTEYIVRLIPNNRIDNYSIFEDVISTGSAGEEGNRNGKKIKIKASKTNRPLSEAGAPSVSLSIDSSRGVTTV